MIKHNISNKISVIHQNYFDACKHQLGKQPYIIIKHYHAETTQERQTRSRIPTLNGKRNLYAHSFKLAPIP